MLRLSQAAALSKAEEVALLRPLEATWAQVFGPCGCCGVGAEEGVFDMDGTKAKALGLIWKKRGYFCQSSLSRRVFFRF